MYRKILIPTDGSELSRMAALAGIQFAGDNQAEVLSIFVAPNYEYPRYVDLMPPGYPTEKEHRTYMRNAAYEYLSDVQKEAEKYGVKFSSDILFSDAVAREIVNAAQENDCDLIFMGSHGRSGWGQALLGSVTAKVLSACAVPVLVYRAKKEAGTKASYLV